MVAGSPDVNPGGFIVQGSYAFLGGLLLIGEGYIFTYIYIYYIYIYIYMYIRRPPWGHEAVKEEAWYPGILVSGILVSAILVSWYLVSWYPGVWYPGVWYPGIWYPGVWYPGILLTMLVCLPPGMSH